MEISPCLKCQYWGDQKRLLGYLLLQNWTLYLQFISQNPSKMHTNNFISIHNTTWKFSAIFKVFEGQKVSLLFSLSLIYYIRPSFYTSELVLFQKYPRMMMVNCWFYNNYSISRSFTTLLNKILFPSNNPHYCSEHNDGNLMKKRWFSPEQQPHIYCKFMHLMPHKSDINHPYTFYLFFITRIILFWTSTNRKNTQSWW